MDPVTSRDLGTIEKLFSEKLDLILGSSGNNPRDEYAAVPDYSTLLDEFSQIETRLISLDIKGFNTEVREVIKQVYKEIKFVQTLDDLLVFLDKINATLNG